MARTVIGFTGKMGCGKSTAAKMLQGFGFTRVRFAGPLKDMMACLGLTQDEIEGHLKEAPCELLGGKTPRFAMQTIGTEWGRETISRNLWIKAWRRRVDALKEYIPVVVDDVRFPNEAEAIKSAGGSIVRIVRGNLHVSSSHPSELMTFDADATITNNGTERDLQEVIRRLSRIDESWIEENAGIPAA
jgi:hypothetical protein